MHRAKKQFPTGLNLTQWVAELPSSNAKHSRREFKEAKSQFMFYYGALNIIRGHERNIIVKNRRYGIALLNNKMGYGGRGYCDTVWKN